MVFPGMIVFFLKVDISARCSSWDRLKPQPTAQELGRVFKAGARLQSSPVQVGDTAWACQVDAAPDLMALRCTEHRDGTHCLHPLFAPAPAGSTA